MLPSRLSQLIRQSLPTWLELTIHHVYHKPTKTAALYTPPPNSAPKSTTLESHFLTVSYQDVFVFAMEILIYVTAAESVGSGGKEATIFISKADSSGFLPPKVASFTHPLLETRSSAFKSIASAFVKYALELVDQTYPTVTKTNVSLFARSQSQYLFPNSAANPQKHVLSDIGLIRWWCLVLDDVLLDMRVKSKYQGCAFLLVPGMDKYKAMTLLPPRTRHTDKNASATEWRQGHPFKVDIESGLTVREIIPHFPDDPKARFLDELDLDVGQTLKTNSGKNKSNPTRHRGSAWAGIRSLDQFWDLMSFRQECSLGHNVGFIWLVFEVTASQITSSDSLCSEAWKSDVNTSRQSKDTGRYDPASVPFSSDLKEDQKMDKEKNPDNVASPTAPVQSGESSDTLRLSGSSYKKLQESLLCADYSTIALAKLHTKKWIEGALVLHSATMNEIVGVHHHEAWGSVITGSIEAPNPDAVEPSTPSTSTANDDNPAAIDARNNLGDSGSRATNLKRNLDQAATVNVLSSGLVRKKHKLK